MGLAITILSLQLTGRKCKVIITKTPYRISFFGGGTDYPEWYEKHGGAVLSTTINKYSYVSVRKLTFHKKLRVIHSEDELCDNRDEVMHAVARETLKYLDIKTGYEIYHAGELPSKSGMGASSVFCVGLMRAFRPRKTPHAISGSAIYIERELMGSTCGDQDQMAAAYGGFNIITFPGHDVISVDENGIFKKLMLFWIGGARDASDVAKTYDFNNCKLTLYKMKEMVNKGATYLLADHDAFGALLDEAWWLKRQLSPVISNSIIDVHYSNAMNNGALGGKILGAGGGGFLLLYVPEEKQDRVKKTMGLMHIPIRYEPNGSQIIYKED